jgi:hypothetical protein
MESTLRACPRRRPDKAKTIVYWMVTALFCLQMSFTAYAQLRLRRRTDPVIFKSVGRRQTVNLNGERWRASSHSDEVLAR